MITVLNLKSAGEMIAEESQQPKPPPSSAPTLSSRKPGFTCQKKRTLSHSDLSRISNLDQQVPRSEDRSLENALIRSHTRDSGEGGMEVRGASEHAKVASFQGRLGPGLLRRWRDGGWLSLRGKKAITWSVFVLPLHGRLATFFPSSSSGTGIFISIFIDSITQRGLPFSKTSPTFTE